ncbi:MAG: choice-of-anchor B family protein [Gemmatimonadota bacterium]|nr:choice-of-anchor B family protein [Gemmatimonadota bacterium]
MRVARFPLLISGLLVTPGFALAQTLPTVPGYTASGFAASIALVGDDILVSRNGAEIRLPTYPEAGAVYVFRRGGDAAWAVEGTVRPGAGAVGDQFGTDIAHAGERLLVGAPGAAEMRGRAYLFERREGEWVERATLDPATEPRAGAGSAVAIAGDAAFLGAPGGLGDLPRFGQPAPAQPGAVYVYAVGPDGAAAMAARLTSPSPEGADRFGAALFAAGDLLVVGAPGSDGGRGAVYRFEREGDAWRPAGAFVLEGLTAGARFGASLVLDGSTLFAGAPGQAGTGVVAAFDVSEPPGAPQLVSPPEGSDATGFGASLAVGGGLLWVGAPGTAAGAGAAYAVDPTSLDHVQSADAAPFGPGAAFGSSLGAGAEMTVVGAGQADLRLGAAAVLEPSDAEGSWVASGTLRDPERPNMTAISGETVSCQDGTALDYACTDVDLVAFLPLAELGAGPTSIANDIWGWTDPETGREYVLLGKSNGTSFVDITDPNAPVYVGELPLTEGGVENLWRDIKTYADHAFIVADNAGAHGVQIFDLTQLRDVRDPPVMFEETAHYDGVFSSHNIVINEETGFAHAVGSSGGGEACGGGLHMIDIRDPANPRFAGCFADPDIGGFLGGGYTHDAQCVIYDGPDEDYVGREICFHASIDALGISDITDKENPVALASANYPGAVAAHQGWLTEDHRYFFLGDELDEEGGTVSNTRTLVWDVEELDDPVLATEYFAETRAIDHNQYVRGDFLYQSNLLGGLRILDIRDPENPVEVAFFDTVPTDDDATAFGGTWSNYPYFESGVIAVSSWNEGLFLLRKRQPVLVP